MATSAVARPTLAPTKKDSYEGQLPSCWGHRGVSRSPLTPSCEGERGERAFRLTRSHDARLSLVQASAAYPENTLASFEAAFKDGAEGIESGERASVRSPSSGQASVRLLWRAKHWCSAWHQLLCRVSRRAGDGLAVTGRALPARPARAEAIPTFRKNPTDSHLMLAPEHSQMFM